MRCAAAPADLGVDVSGAQGGGGSSASSLRVRSRQLGDAAGDAGAEPDGAAHSGSEPKDVDMDGEEVFDLEGIDTEEGRAALVEEVVDYYKSSASEQGHAIVDRTRQDRTDEQEEAIQEEMRTYLASEGVDSSSIPVEIIELDDASMSDAPEVKYSTDKKQMIKAFNRGDIHLMEEACTALLNTVPDDPEVWRSLTMSRLRLKLWDAALRAARRWIAFDPYSVAPRNAEALALIGCQEYGEARARFQQLAVEVEPLDAEMAKALREAVWRIDELWMTPEPGICQFSARPITVITGARPPHFYMPNFADSVGPLKVLHSEADEVGGGQSHRRKLVVTRDVAAGEPLFIQSALAFGLVEIDEHLERLSEGLVTVATTSPRAAALMGLLADDGPLEEENEVLATIADPSAARGGSAWSREPAEMDAHLDTCRRVFERSQLSTGQSYRGVWSLPGLARHSCLPSANYTCFGDTCVGRAARDMKAGDEVTFSFWDVLEPLETRRQAATEKCGGFWCRCPRCEAEDAMGQEVSVAAEKMRGVFLINTSRVTAMKEQLFIKMEEKKNQLEKSRDAYNSDDRAFEEGLRGLADKFKSPRPGAVTESEIDELRQFVPEVNAPELVSVPKGLADELLRAVQDFEDFLDAAELTEEQRSYIVASHLPYYSEVLVLVVLRKDLAAQRFLAPRMLSAVSFVAPGSFEHQRLAVYNWEVAWQCEDPSLSRVAPDRELAPREKELAYESLRLRYGRDLSLVEMEAAMARTACSRYQDENWCWDVSWCIGCTPQEPDAEDAQAGVSVI